MKLLFRLVSVVLIFLLFLLLILWLIGRQRVQAVVWQPASSSGFVNEFAPNDVLNQLQLKQLPSGHGPEDIAYDGLQFYYTGLEDGRILKFVKDGEFSEFVNTGGRPLGMQFDRNKNLIVADSVKGLLSIAPDGEITVLADSVKAEKMLFVDDLDIASDGTIWFSDASMRFGFDKTIYDFIEASMTGRLLSYSPHTKEVRVHMENLFFSNGVALGPNEDFVLVNETGTGRIHRLWLKGANKGVKDIFIDGLPGNPDNLSFNGKDIFWVAMAGRKDPKMDALADKVLIRTIIAGLPISMIKTEHDQAFILGLDVDGNVKYNLQSNTHRFRSVTSVNQYGDKLFVGSLKLPAYAVYDLK